MTSKDQSKFPYDRSEYVVMPPIRKAEDGTLTTEKLDVEALKREILSDIQAAKAFITGHRAGEKRSGAAKDYLDLVDKVFDHLQSAYKGVENLQCRAPLPKIDGLEEEIRDDDKLHEISESHKRLNDPPRLLSKTQQAARAYLKLQGGE